MDGWKRFDTGRRKLLALLGALGVTAAGVLLLAQKATAKTYVITDGQRVVTYTTFATDPAQVLGEAGLELEAWDTYYSGGGDIQVCRAQRVSVCYRGQRQVVSAREETVAQLLARLALEVTEHDRLSHDPGLWVWDGMQLRIDHHFSQEEIYTVAVPHAVSYCYDASLPQGTREVLIPGVDGELLRTAQVTYVNFQESQRQILSETMTIAPVTELVAIGTGTAPEAADPTDMPVIGDGYIRLPTGEVLTYYDTAQVRATAYTHTDAGCDLITYTGTRVRVGTVAVDPRFIPYGTRMFIVSNDGSYVYGISVAEDCGGAIKRDRIDLYFPTYDQCIQFGRRSCTIYFLG